MQVMSNPWLHQRSEINDYGFVRNGSNGGITSAGPAQSGVVPTSSDGGARLVAATGGACTVYRYGGGILSLSPPNARPIFRSDGQQEDSGVRTSCNESLPRIVNRGILSKAGECPASAGGEAVSTNRVIAPRTAVGNRSPWGPPVTQQRWAS